MNRRSSITGTQKRPSASVARASLDEARRLSKDVFSDQPVDIYLCGSWARGDAGPSADIDIAIDAQGSFDDTCLTKLRLRLEESHIPYRVDVIDLRHVSADFRARVLREGILW